MAARASTNPLGRALGARMVYLRGGKTGFQHASATLQFQGHWHVSLASRTRFTLRQWSYEGLSEGALLLDKLGVRIRC